jgi:hypothetical protein
MNLGTTPFVALLLSAFPAVAASPYSGAWSCRNTEGFELFANLELQDTPQGVVGTWSDGTRIRLFEGELQGNIQDDKLYFSQCNNGAHGEGHGPTCPSFGPPENYLTVRHGKLHWYAKADNGYKLFYVLSRGRAGVGHSAPRNCSNDL